MKKNNRTIEECGQGPRRLTPQQQLWELIDVCKQELISKVFRRLKKRDQEDLSYAMVAYIRFHITRDFDCPFMQILYHGIINMVDVHPSEFQPRRRSIIIADTGKGIMSRSPMGRNRTIKIILRREEASKQEFKRQVDLLFGLAHVSNI